MGGSQQWNRKKKCTTEQTDRGIKLPRIFLPSSEAAAEKRVSQASCQCEADHLHLRTVGAVLYLAFNSKPRNSSEKFFGKAGGALGRRQRKGRGGESKVKEEG